MFELQMNNKFYSLLERIFKQYVKALLDDRAKLKSVLCDYAEGEFSPEIHLFLQAIEAGCHTRIAQADDIQLAAGACSRLLRDNYYLTQEAADYVTALLCKLLRGYDMPKKTPENAVQGPEIAGNGLNPQRIGGRYAPLYDYLAAQRNNNVNLTFAEIENILGARLPRSARVYRAWWANGGHTQAESWLQAGFRVGIVEQAAGYVIFERIHHK
jgi:hypothetical protein